MFLQLLQYVEPGALGWVFGLSLVLAVAMGFATGANDVANTFGTSVGSGALTLRKALVAAGVFEMLGALALGSHVAGTLKSGIAYYSCFSDEPSLYMVGMTSALGAAALWLIFASLAGLPVSATHSIVGGIVGMALALKGRACVNWGMTGVAKIAISWISSPLLASAAAFLVYTLVTRLVFQSRDSFERSLWATPILLAGAVLFLEMLTFWEFVKPWWAKLLLFAGSSVLVFALTSFFGVPYLRKAISKSYSGVNGSFSNGNQKGSFDSLDGLVDNHTGMGDAVPMEDMGPAKKQDMTDTAQNDVSDGIVIVALDEGQSGNELSIPDRMADTTGMESEKAKQVFWYLQNFTACFGSFAHGANDTANTIGPFAAIYHLWKDGTFDAAEPVPLWIVAIGGASIVLGLAILGYRVIQTMGKEIIHIDYASGFSSELSSSMTVVIASRLQIPVSSTHCQVGAIVGVGLVNSNVNQTQNSSASISNTSDQPRDEETAQIAGQTSFDTSSDSNADSVFPHPFSAVKEPSWSDSIKESLSHIQWKSIGKIFISWLVTVPVSAAVAALLSVILKQFINGN
jgi:phosphate/sulfate permease